MCIDLKYLEMVSPDMQVLVQQQFWEKMTPMQVTSYGECQKKLTSISVVMSTKFT